jgi:hypothetical protein
VGGKMLPVFGKTGSIAKKYIKIPHFAPKKCFPKPLWGLYEKNERNTPLFPEKRGISFTFFAIDPSCIVLQLILC